jgi:hypothetical protein
MADTGQKKGRRAMKTISFILLLGIFSTLFAGEGRTYKAIQLINRTSFDFIAVRLSPAGTHRWGDNILVTGVFQKGEQEKIRFVPADSTVCDYDIRAEKVNGDSIVFKSIDLCHLLDISLYYEDGTPYIRQNIIIENQSGFTFSEIYISESGMDFWSNNLLGSVVLNYGDETCIAFNPEKQDCMYDIRAKLLNGRDVIFRNIIMCKTFKITLFWGEGVPYVSFWDFY